MKASANVHLLLVVALAIVFASMRAAGMLESSNLQYLLPLSFMLMALMPWVLLNREGRKQMGLVFPTRIYGFILAISLDALLATTCFVLGFVLF